MQQTKNRVPENTSKSKIPDTARPFALVSGAREAYLNFLRNLTPPIVLMTILVLSGVKLYQRWEIMGVFLFAVLVIAIILSFYNNVNQLAIKISESYAVENLGMVFKCGIRGMIDTVLTLAIAMVCFAVVLSLGLVHADQIIKNNKTTEQGVIEQKHSPISDPLSSKLAP